MSNLKIILLVHFVLSLVPFGGNLVPIHYVTLPVVEVLGSIHWSQLMLLSIYGAMFAGNTRNRLLLATVGFIYVEICQAISLGLFSHRPLDSLGDLYWSYLTIENKIFIVLIVILSLARLAVGGIRRVLVIPPNSVNDRPQFSLLMFLLILSLAPLVMGLVRFYRLETDILYQVRFVSLHGIVHGINVVAAVWATMGTGSIPRKLTVAAAISLILGLSLGVAKYHQSYGWMGVAITSLQTLSPTVIISSTLLSLRAIGFRLSPLAADELSIEPLPETRQAERTHWRPTDIGTFTDGSITKTTTTHTPGGTNFLAYLDPCDRMARVRGV